ncbi:hypothetical protein KSX_58570 [Ktedonospora formicarum]|uniref:Alpha/beta hydrolase fold-3 domain-containing protein n=1 Tax=Ktedonospora formicarum TaxID=2778364 RepID=A0A8J3IAG0_9CHLR|nr:hypothetical protein KSX_58570 [Ktedonospora formicarum]
MVSPLYAELHGFPPSFIQVGQNEMLYDDACQLAKRIKEHHGRVHCVVWENMFHGWHLFADELPEGQLALEQVAAYFEKYFESSI